MSFPWARPGIKSKASVKKKRRFLSTDDWNSLNNVCSWNWIPDFTLSIKFGGWYFAPIRKWAPPFMWNQNADTKFAFLGMEAICLVTGALMYKS